jgi:drug/metabolite transporter (DMT)-like permease
VGIWRSIFYGDLAAFLLLSVWFARASGTARLFTSHPAAWIASFVAGVILLAAAGLLTRGLTRGTLAVVAPVTASYGAIAALLSAATGERLSVRAAWGIFFTACGVCLVSLPAGGRRELRNHLHASGFGWAVGAAVCYAVGFWLQGVFAVPALGPFIPVWLSYGIVVAAIPVLMPVIGARLAIPRGNQWWAVLGAGLFSATAYVALTIGQSTGWVAIVVVLSTLASAVTVLLSRLIDRATIALHQWLAMGVIIAGLILIKG